MAAETAHVNFDLGGKGYHAIWERFHNLGDSVSWEWRYFHDDLRIKKPPWEWLTLRRPQLQKMMELHPVPFAQLCFSAGRCKSAAQHREHLVGTRCLLLILCAGIFKRQAPLAMRSASWDILRNICSLCAHVGSSEVVVPILNDAGFSGFT